LTDLIPTTPTDLSEIDDIARAGQMADEAAKKTALYRYLDKKALETLRRQRADLKLFEKYLHEIKVPLEVAMDVYAWKKEKDAAKRAGIVLDLSPWGRLSSGLVQGFIHWQLAHDYDIDSINVRFATVRMYCKVATSAGYLNKEVYQDIALIEPYRGREAINADASREKTRMGHKKTDAIILTKEQITQLKQQPATPQGYRDKVIIALFFDHGLRCSELAGLKREDIRMDEGKMTFYRKKVDKIQTHELSRDALLALTHYLQMVELAPNEQLLRGSKKGLEGTRLGGSMGTRSITARVNALGRRIGVEKLSAHDGRDNWATWAARSGTSVNDLADAGGWSNIYTPYNKYVKPNNVANKGIILGY
jgi:integrase